MPLAVIDLEGAALTADERAVLADEPVAGICLFARNTPDRARARDLVADARAAAGRPLLVSIDQEGGGVARLTDGAVAPAAMALGAIDDLATTEAVAAATARSLRAIGVDVDFAPVADVALDPRNPVPRRRQGSDHAPRPAPGDDHIELARWQLPGRFLIGVHLHLPSLGAPLHAPLRAPLRPSL